MRERNFCVVIICTRIRKAKIPRRQSQQLRACFLSVEVSSIFVFFLWSTFYTSLLQLSGRPKKSVACFYFLSIFFRVSYPRSSLIGTQSKIGHMLRSESALRIHAQNLGCISFKNWGPKQPALDVYRRLRNLTAKIFGTEQETDKLTTRKQRFKLRKVPYVQSKFDEI